MSHTLTEVDAFTTPITVPDGTDSRSNAAEVVAAIAQALANRTKNLDTHAAKKNAANTFTGAPQKVAVTNAELAALVVDLTAADDPGDPANLWKNSLGFNIADNGGYNNFYAGTRTGPGSWIHVINAVWVVADQWWIADNPAQDSLALIFDPGTGLVVSRRPAGVGHWTSWPLASGDLLLGGNANVNGHAVVGGNITMGGEISYATPQGRSVACDLILAQNLKFGALGEYFHTNYGVDPPQIPISPLIPTGAVITGVDCVMNSAISSASTFKLYKRLTNYVSPAAPTITQVGADATTPASSGYHTTSIVVASGGTIGRTATEYYVEWIAGNAGDSLVGIRVNYTQPGPRNY